MTRKFKVAGVLVAVVAMFALSASSASATFTSTLTENSGTATSTADNFDAFGSTVQCTNNEFHVGNYNTTQAGEPGKHVEADFPTNTLTVVPTYSNCTAFGLPETVNFTGCDYVLHHVGGVLTVDLVCPAGVKGVDKTLYTSAAHTTAICHIVITPYTGKGGLTASNNGNHILIKGTLEGIVAHQERTNFLCPAGTETKTMKYTIQPEGITIKGTPESAISVS